MRAHLHLDWPGKEGPLRKHLEAVERNTGRHDPQLDSVQVPKGFESLWSTFWDLAGGDRLSFRELVAYQEATGKRLTAWEIETIRAMDAEYQAFVADRMKGEANA